MEPTQKFAMTENVTMELTEDQFRYLATVCGGIYHCWTTYNHTEVIGRDLEYINSFFKTKNERYFLFRSATFTMRIENDKGLIDYVHDSYQIEKRKVTVQLKRQEN